MLPNNSVMASRSRCPLRGTSPVSNGTLCYSDENPSHQANSAPSSHATCTLASSGPTCSCFLLVCCLRTVHQLYHISSPLTSSHVTPSVFSLSLVHSASPFKMVLPSKQINSLRSLALGQEQKKRKKEKMKSNSRNQNIYTFMPNRSTSTFPSLP